MFEGLGVADWVIWYTIAQYVGLLVIGGYLLYKTRFKIGFKAVFLRRVGVGERLEGVELDPVDVAYGYVSDKRGEYQFVGEKEFKSTDKVVSFKGGSFSPDLEFMTYRKFGFQYLFFDFDSGALLNFGGELKGVDPRYAQRHLKSGVLERFLIGAGALPKMFWVLFVVCVVAVGVSTGIGGYLYGVMGNHTVGLVFV